MAAKKNRRKANLSQIHILQKELGLDDDAYRLMLAQVTGKESSADMNDKERWRVISHMQGLQNRPNGYPGRPHNIEQSPQMQKIEALLTIGRRPWAYADALSKQLSRDGSIQYERVAFAPTWLLKKVISALIRQGKREGWDLE